MKKVFAFLSVLALTLAVLGFATKPAVVNAADPGSLRNFRVSLKE